MNRESWERIVAAPLAVAQRRWNIRVVVAADDYTVTTISQDMNDREEYARLFAAAPELLAALKQYVATYPAFKSRPIGAPGSPARIEQDVLIAMEMAARTAIAKAEGTDV